MRATQPYGLPESARVFLLEHAVRRNPCVHCGRYDGYESRIVGCTGMFDDLHLHEHKLKDGRTATEIVQFQFDWSGPMIWLALVVSDGKKFEWDAENVAEHLPNFDSRILREEGWEGYFRR